MQLIYMYILLNFLFPITIIKVFVLKVLMNKLLTYLLTYLLTIKIFEFFETQAVSIPCKYHALLLAWRPYAWRPYAILKNYTT